MSKKNTGKKRKNSSKSLQKKPENDIFQMLFEIIFFLYAVFMFIVYPLYLENGYYMITDGKLHFYQKLHIGFFIIVVFVLLVKVICEMKNKGFREVFLSFGKNFVDQENSFFTLILLFLVSTYLAADRKTSIYGFQDWYMGILMYGSFFLLYLCYSYLFHFRKYCIYMLGTIASVICVLGYLQRFHINLVSKKGFVLGSDILSTIGNINWICDFVAVLLMLVIYLFLSSKKLYVKILFGVLLFFDYGFLAIQASDSGYLIISFSLLLTFLVIAYLEKKEVYSFFLVCAIANLGVWLTGVFFRNALQSGKTVMLDEMSNWVYSGLWLILGLVSAILFLVFFIRLKEVRFKRKVAFFTAGTILTLGVILFAFIIVHSKNESFLPWMEKYDYFRFGPSWGHDRGGNWIISLGCFQKCSIWRELFGFGPDCFYFCMQEYGIQLNSWSADYLNIGQNLTNAHNEVITLLINFGILGVISYYTFFVDKMRKILKNARENELCVWIVSCLVLSFLHNLVSFQQIIATPFVFILLGLGNCLSRKSVKS